MGLDKIKLSGLVIFLGVILNSCTFFANYDPGLNLAADLYLQQSFSNVLESKEAQISLLALAQPGVEFIKAVFEVQYSSIPEMDSSEYMKVIKAPKMQDTGYYSAIVEFDVSLFLVQLLRNRVLFGRSIWEILSGTLDEDLSDTEEKALENLGCRAFYLLIGGLTLLSSAESCKELTKDAEVDSIDAFIDKLLQQEKAKAKVKLIYDQEDIGGGEIYVTLQDFEEY